MTPPAPLWRRFWWTVPLAAALVAADVAFEVNFPFRAEVVLETPKLPTGTSVRVLHLSDVHNKEFPDGNARLFQLMTEARPDLVVVTGDLIDFNTFELDYIVGFMRRIVELCPHVYYVNGNHEWWNARRSQKLNQQLAAQGVTVLRNQPTVYKKGDLTINILGLDDAYSHHDDMLKTIAGVDPKPLTLLISHSPAPARWLYNTPVDIMLAGHTHGGQVRLPLIGAVVAPGEGYFPHFDKGRFELPEGRQLYIDSGLGTSTLPLRFLNRSQFSLVTLTGR